MPTITENSTRITNVSPEECIPLTFTVTVSYTNANSAEGVLSVSCADATITPASQPATGASGTRTFTITHTAAASNHTITATLTHGTSTASDSVTSVGVGNPCPVVIGGVLGFLDGLPSLDANAALHGTFNAKVGNRIVLMIEEPSKVVAGKIRPAKLLYVDPADVSIDPGPPIQGIWKHQAIPMARPGQHLRVVLTKDGNVQAIVRAIFE